jgi:hypothetical protein
LIHHVEWTYVALISSKTKRPWWTFLQHIAMRRTADWLGEPI